MQDQGGKPCTGDVCGACAVRVSTGDTDERVVQAIHLTINGMVARSLGIGTGTVQRISGERAMSLRAAEQ